MASCNDPNPVVPTSGTSPAGERTTVNDAVRCPHSKWCPCPVCADDGWGRVPKPDHSRLVYKATAGDAHVGIPFTEAELDRLARVAHAAYHEHNELCRCREVGDLTRHIALAVCGEIVNPTKDYA